MSSEKDGKVVDQDGLSIPRAFLNSCFNLANLKNRSTAAVPSFRIVVNNALSQMAGSFAIDGCDSHHNPALIPVFPTETPIAYSNVARA